MFKKLLVANRGEIAVRVIKACRELGIKTVAICSEPDKNAMHARLADELYLLEGKPAQVYLDAKQIVDIALKAKVEAIHPGYGFLAENAGFAQTCLDNGIIFVGPSPNAIAMMGSKVEARRIMKKAGVPVVPGTVDPVSDVAKVKELAVEFGYPLAIKASAGGGGRGFRIVRSEAEVEQALAGAQREGESYFGNKEVYVEKYLERPHHVEVQIIGDNHGNVLHLYERDCSSQRRHQKLLEEAPGPDLSPAVRAKLLDAAVRAGKSIGYTSLGTIECLVWGEEFYFLEVNTRVQVEHPITELITGIDVVKEQLLVAAGEPLSFKQEDVCVCGHAIECRINAEDPFKQFIPSPGKITNYVEPKSNWVRVDSACYSGYEVLPFYDSLLAKLVVWGRTREEAIARMKIALKDYVIEGVSTTIPFHYWILDQKDFLKGQVDTTWVESHLKEFTPHKERILAELASSPRLLTPATTAPTTGTPRTFEVNVNQRIYKVQVAEEAKSAQAATQAPQSVARPIASGKPGSNGHSGDVLAEMHGLVKEILIKEGDAVSIGQRLMIFEAMKMESEILSRKAGKVVSLKVKAGETVEAKTLLVVVGD